MNGWHKIDDAVRASPKVKIAALDTVRAELFADQKDAEKQVVEDAAAINVLQDRLFAERKRALLVVLQGMDTSGKDGTVRGVFNVTGPLGVIVTPFFTMKTLLVVASVTKPSAFRRMASEAPRRLASTIAMMLFI